jgi:hypothetical protein
MVRDADLPGRENLLSASLAASMLRPLCDSSVPELDGVLNGAQIMESIGQFSAA